MPAAFLRAAALRLMTAAFALTAVLWLGLAVAVAQPAEELDYSAWDRTASRGEQLLDEDGLTTDQLEAMRADVVAWRDRFGGAQSLNAPRIATVRDQIAALGPAPAEGETEPEDIAARRQELNAQLAELQAPAQRATEAYSRADSLVRAIDEQLRAQQTNALLRLSPSPLLPSSWAAAANEGMQVVQGVLQDVRDRTYGAAGDALVRRIPAVGLYLLLALGLLIFGRRWVDKLPSRLSARASDYARDAVSFTASLGQIVIPTVGAYLLVRAVDTTGLVGQWGRPILMALPVAALILFAGRWLGRRFFPLNSDPPICYPAEKRQAARRHATLLAVASALHHVAAQALLPLSTVRASVPAGRRIPLEISEGAAAVWHLPIVLLGALALYRLGHVLHRANAYTTPGTPGYRNRIASILGNLARLVAIISSLAVLVGFVTLGNALLWPMAMTVALAALVILLQELATDLWVIVRRNRDGSRNDLTPVLIGFALVIAALPVLALVWGARPTELAEFWTGLRQGITLGGVRLSLGALLTFFIVFGLGFVLTRVVQGAVRTSILPRTKLDEGAQNAAVSGLGYVGIFLAALMAITSAGIDLSSFAIVAGALSVGIGFGLQNIVSNFVSGIILLVERPVAVGDWIQVGNAQGYVRRISVRSTRIQTFDRTDIVVPNQDLIAKEVTNWTRGNLQGRIIVPVNVAYGADTRRVSKILMDIAEDQPTVLINPAPSVLFTGFANEGMTFEIRAIISDINQGMGVSTEIRHQIVERFRREGIAIPFTVRDFYNEEGTVLSQAAAIAGKSPGDDDGKEEGSEEEQLKVAVASSPKRVSSDGNGPEGLDPRIARASSSGMEDAGDNDGPDQR